MEDLCTVVALRIGLCCKVELSFPELPGEELMLEDATALAMHEIGRAHV